MRRRTSKRLPTIEGLEQRLALSATGVVDPGYFGEFMAYQARVAPGQGAVIAAQITAQGPGTFALVARTVTG